MILYIFYSKLKLFILAIQRIQLFDKVGCKIFQRKFIKNIIIDRDNVIGKFFPAVFCSKIYKRKNLSACINRINVIFFVDNELFSFLQIKDFRFQNVPLFISEKGFLQTIFCSRSLMKVNLKLPYAQ